MNSEKKTTTTPPTPAEADERNLVSESAASNLPLEDQLQIWWDTNKFRMLGIAALILLVVAGWQGIRLARESAEAQIQEIYQALVTDEEKLAFANEHPNHPLGGIAWLSLADQSFSEETYSDAESYYRNAVQALDPSPFQDRARLGTAMAALKNGKRGETLTLLEALANDETAFGASRAEAAFHRAILALEDNDQASYDRFTELINSIPFSEGWSSRLTAIEPAG